MKWLKRLLRIHEHEKKVFCVGETAFVKCVTCGYESVPWRVSKSTATEWKRCNPNAIDELLAIDRKVGILHATSPKQGGAE